MAQTSGRNLLIYSILKSIRGTFERRIHRLEPDAVLSAQNYPWAKALEAAHPHLEKEAEFALTKITSIINFDEVVKNQRALYQREHWKSFFLIALGQEVPLHRQLCPHTAQALRNIPGIINAFYSILMPGTEIPPHRGPHAGILRYHLGVIVPDGDVGIRIDGRDYRWQEGQSLFFDDSFEHSAWNRTQSVRVVLFVDLVRPLPRFLSVANRAMLLAFRFSRTVRQARQTIFANQLSTELEPLSPVP